MKAIGYIVTTAFVTTYGAILNGWALSKLWAWFIAKTFGLPLLTIPAAIGLALVVSYLTHQVRPSEEKKEYWETLLEAFVMSTLKPLLVLLIGVIVKIWL